MIIDICNIHEQASKKTRKQARKQTNNIGFYIAPPYEQKNGKIINNPTNKKTKKYK